MNKVFGLKVLKGEKGQTEKNTKKIENLQRIIKSQNIKIEKIDIIEEKIFLLQKGIKALLKPLEEYINIQKESIIKNKFSKRKKRNEV